MAAHYGVFVVGDAAGSRASPMRKLIGDAPGEEADARSNTGISVTSYVCVAAAMPADASRQRLAHSHQPSTTMSNAGRRSGGVRTRRHRQGHLVGEVDDHRSIPGATVRGATGATQQRHELDAVRGRSALQAQNFSIGGSTPVTICLPFFTSTRQLTRSGSPFASNYVSSRMPGVSFVV